MVENETSRPRAVPTRRLRIRTVVPSDTDSPTQPAQQPGLVLPDQPVPVACGSDSAASCEKDWISVLCLLSILWPSQFWPQEAQKSQERSNRRQVVLDPIKQATLILPGQLVLPHPQHSPAHSPQRAVDDPVPRAVKPSDSLSALSGIIRPLSQNGDYSGNEELLIEAGRCAVSWRL